MELILRVVKNTDPLLREEMKIHYSKPLGFVGRNICYEISYGSTIFGHIVAGSATRFLPGRNAFFGVDCLTCLNGIINSIFFHIEPKIKYPVRNFSSKILLLFEQTASKNWEEKYGDSVFGFESLVELPRSGETYRRAGYSLIGETKGFTCKRFAGRGSDSWSGKRVWDTQNLRPKLVFAKKCFV